MDKWTFAEIVIIAVTVAVVIALAELQGPIQNRLSKAQKKWDEQRKKKRAWH